MTEQHTPALWVREFLDTRAGILEVDLGDGAGANAIRSVIEPLCAYLEHRLSRDANASLIDAAPDLFSCMLDLFENPQFQVAIGGNPNMVDSIMDRARAAIAKARGAA